MAFYANTESTVEKDAQMNRKGQGIGKKVLSRFSVYIRVCGEKNVVTFRTHAKKNTLSTFLFILSADYVTFLMKKHFCERNVKNTQDFKSVNVYQYKLKS